MVRFFVFPFPFPVPVESIRSYGHPFLKVPVPVTAAINRDSGILLINADTAGSAILRIDKRMNTRDEALNYYAGGKNHA